MATSKIKIIACLLQGLLLSAFVEAQFEAINPFVMPNEFSLNWYGSGDINRDQKIGSGDLSRLDSLLSGTFSDPGDTRLLDRADINGDQFITQDDWVLLDDFVEGKRDCLPAHWNCLSSKEERISWLQKILSIDQTEDGISSVNYIGDFYADQLFINIHGLDDAVLQMFPSPPIDYQHNGRFNLPLCYVGVFQDSVNITSNRNINAILIGDNVFDWDDWYYIDPQLDTFAFPEGSIIAPSNSFSPNFENYLDDMTNITRRDLVPPSVDLSISGNSASFSSGYVNLSYSLADPILKNANYYLNNPSETNVLYMDSLIWDSQQENLIPSFNKSGDISLVLSDGQYQFMLEATDHLFNRTNRTILLMVNDLPPVISVFSPVNDSIYTEESPFLHYQIEELDFASASYSLDSGQTILGIGQNGNVELDLPNGNHHMIVLAEDDFGNTDTAIIRFTLELQNNTTGIAKEDDSRIRVYPNPVQDNLLIQISGNSLYINHLSIQDMNSRVLWESSPREIKNSNYSMSLDFASYPPGIYFLKFSLSNDRTVMKMIIKQ